MLLQVMVTNRDECVTIKVSESITFTEDLTYILTYGLNNLDWIE